MGDVKWVDTKGSGDFIAEPKYSQPPGSEQSVVYIIERQTGKVRQYDASTGERNWEFDCVDLTGDANCKDSVEAEFTLSSDGNILYYGDISGKITAIQVAAFGMPLPPTEAPTTKPTSSPSSAHPSLVPSIAPSHSSSSAPTTHHSFEPSTSPSSKPSVPPTSEPSIHPSFDPSTDPTFMTSLLPSIELSAYPTSKPSFRPSSYPSAQSSSKPSLLPSSDLSVHPSSSTLPSSYPSVHPSPSPSRSHTSEPSSRPSLLLSSEPSGKPSILIKTESVKLSPFSIDLFIPLSRRMPSKSYASRHLLEVDEQEFLQATTAHLEAIYEKHNEYFTAVELEMTPKGNSIVNASITVTNEFTGNALFAGTSSKLMPSEDEINSVTAGAFEDDSGTEFLSRLSSLDDPVLSSVQSIKIVKDDPQAEIVAESSPDKTHIAAASKRQGQPDASPVWLNKTVLCVGIALVVFLLVVIGVLIIVHKRKKVREEMAKKKQEWSSRCLAAEDLILSQSPANNRQEICIVKKKKGESNASYSLQKSSAAGEEETELQEDSFIWFQQASDTTRTSTEDSDPDTSLDTDIETTYTDVVEVGICSPVDKYTVYEL